MLRMANRPLMTRITVLVTMMFLSSCSEIEPKPSEPSAAHIKLDDSTSTQNSAAIPALVTPKPVLPEPSNAPDLDRYTVVVNEVPVKELLFALARDAKVNVDIAPDIEGTITINAVDQTLPQILDRISRQVDMRYEFDGVNILVSKDAPYYHTYKVDYVNMSRQTDSQITIATQIATTGSSGVGGTGGASGGGGGNNNSTTDVQSVSINNFWENLVQSIKGIIGEDTESVSEVTGEVTRTNNVIPSPETGVLTVNATAKQHEQIQQLIDKVITNANRQVLVQATIVEVTLNDKYQAGIDWSFIKDLAGFTINTASVVAGTSAFGAEVITPILNYDDTNIGDNTDDFKIDINLLDEFGDAKVLSSPQLMVLNNQTAVLKVVDNIVFFTVEQENSQTQTSNVVTFETTINTVPVGIIMSMTPYISDNDSVILNVRPTISRVSGFKNDPNPALTVQNQIPEIQVREMESMLRMNNGQIAVLGGLMQDETNDLDRSIPGISRIPGVGKLFQSTNINNTKSELVIFLKPTVIKNPSIDSDLELYRGLLQQSSNIPDSAGNGEG